MEVLKVLKSVSPIQLWLIINDHCMACLNRLPFLFCKESISFHVPNSIEISVCIWPFISYPCLFVFIKILMTVHDLAISDQKDESKSSSNLPSESEEEDDELQYSFSSVKRNYTLQS